jgi:hypothetical protein
MTARARRVWAGPLALAAATLVGLLSALLGDDVWDALSWLALAAPVVLIVWKIARAR